MNEEAKQVLFSVEALNSAQAAVSTAAKGHEAKAVATAFAPYVQAALDEAQQMIATAMGTALRGAAAQNIVEDVLEWVESQRVNGDIPDSLNELYRIAIGTNV